MTANDILRRLRFALNIPERRLGELFALADYRVSEVELSGIFAKEDEPGYIECPGETLRLFLDGLVAWKRGRQDGAKTPPAPRTGAVSNNDVLRAIKIALELRDEDLIAIMKLAGVEVSKAEVNAFFRKKGHENWRQCGDQFLRNFLVGLTAKYRAI